LTVKGGLSGISADLSAKRDEQTLHVSADLTRVQATLPRSFVAPDVVQWSVPFFWVNPAVLPRRVTLHLDVSTFGITRHRHTLVGLHLGSSAGIQANLLDFVATRGDWFYFPGGADLPSVMYETLSPLVAPLQDLPDTTVWGTMWPHELPFWRSFEGIDFLAQQVLGLERDERRARRIAIDPLTDGSSSSSSSSSSTLAMDFLAELEVHFRCGVDIRVLESAALAAELGNAGDALLCLGGTLGVYYREIWAGTKESRAALMLDSAGIATMREQYDTMQRSGVPWRAYVGRRILWTSIPRRDYIEARVSAVRARAKQLSTLRAAIGARGTWLHVERER
jgi:hypothetical protein